MSAAALKETQTAAQGNRSNSWITGRERTGNGSATSPKVHGSRYQARPADMRVFCGEPQARDLPKARQTSGRVEVNCGAAKRMGLL